MILQSEESTYDIIDGYVNKELQSEKLTCKSIENAENIFSRFKREESSKDLNLKFR